MKGWMSVATPCATYAVCLTTAARLANMIASLEPLGFVGDRGKEPMSPPSQPFRPCWNLPNHLFRAARSQAGGGVSRDFVETGASIPYPSLIQ